MEVWRAGLGAVGLFAASMWGCAAETPGGCTRNADCTANAVCHAGVCEVDESSSTSGPTGGASGSSSSGVLGVAPTACLDGTECIVDSDCASGYLCNELLAPRQCEQIGCGAEGTLCSEDAACAPGLTCPVVTCASTCLGCKLAITQNQPTKACPASSVYVKEMMDCMCGASCAKYCAAQCTTGAALEGDCAACLNQDCAAQTSDCSAH